MSQDVPPAPPEAGVIRLAREAMNMTAQSAAEASRSHDGRGISAAYWRDVERGYGGRRGKRVPTRASGRALASMARVVGVTPAQLTAAGRRDAARVLEEALRRGDAGPAGPRLLQLPEPPEGPMFAKYRVAAVPLATRILRRLDELRELGIKDPDGLTMFPDLADESLALGWEAGREAELSPEENLWVLATARTGIDQYRREHERSRSGTGGP